MSNADHFREGPKPYPKSVKDVEIERLKKLPHIPEHPHGEDSGSGVLLSDRIVHFAQKYRMIDPFDDSEKGRLKAASYELSVGDKYAKDGKINSLNQGEMLTVEPFNVVIIQTLETLNLPRFLIARWNLRIRWVYKGLLWVGAPQVDPGFRGYLAFPLYNLSNKRVTIGHGDAVAAMDFVYTTPVVASSRAYPWETRTRVTLDDYEQDDLRSALFTEAAEKLQKLDGTLAESRDYLDRMLDGVSKRIDSFTVVTFAILAILFAALGLAAVRSPETTFWTSSVPLAAVALWFALRAFYRSHAEQMQLGRLWFEIGLGLFIAAGLVTYEYKSISRNMSDWSAVKAAATEAQQRSAEVQSEVAARRDLERRLDSLQEQLDGIRQQKQQR